MKIPSIFFLNLFFQTFSLRKSLAQNIFDIKTEIKITENYFKCKNTPWITWIACNSTLEEDGFVFNHFSTLNIPVKLIKDVNDLLNIIQFGENVQNGLVTRINCFSNILTGFNEDVQRLLFHLRMHWLIFPEKDMTVSGVTQILQPGLLLVHNQVGVIFHESGREELTEDRISSNNSMQATGVMIKPEMYFEDLEVAVYEFYKFKQFLPLKSKSLFNGPIKDMSQKICAIDPPAKRRANFELVPLRSVLVIAYPHLFTGIDIRSRHIDTYGKVNWLTINNLRSALNFSFDFFHTDDYGWDKYGNGTFVGLMGYLQRREVEFGMSASLMRSERTHIVDRTAETFRFQSAILFRQPPLATINNIFILPFDNRVWWCVGAFMLLSILVTYAQKLVDTNSDLLESTSVTIGAICQQGRDYLPTSVSGRFAVLVIFTISVFIYTSYSACIVALLQSPSNAIKTVTDLTESPIRLACQNILYNKLNFEAPGNPASIEELYVKKMKSKPETEKYIPINVGMRRVQTEQFAFQVELHAANKYISEHYFDYEKCQLGEIEVFRLPLTTTLVQKNSSLREVFTLK